MAKFMTPTLFELLPAIQNQNFANPPPPGGQVTLNTFFIEHLWTTASGGTKSYL